MTMSKASEGEHKTPPDEYSVYIFHRPFHNDNRADPCPKWERRHTTRTAEAAYRKAEKLFRTNEYDRVEIKKKFFDRRAKRRFDKTLKIYRETEDRLVGMFISFLLVLMAGCALTGMALLFMLPAD